ncbi:MAG: polysaccharide biosynthesis protein [Mariniblastus sp.]
MHPDLNTTDHPVRESTLTKTVNFAKDHRLPLLVLGHAVVFGLVFLGAFLIRLDVDFPINVDQVWKKFWAGLPLVVGVKVCVYYALRNFHGWWRYVTFSDFISLIRASTASMLLIIAIDHFVLPYQIPRSVLVFDWVLSVVALGTLRSFWRVWDERIAPLDRGRKSRDAALIIGAEMESAKLAHLINSQQGLGFRIVGLVSPKRLDKTRRFSDLRVVGSLEDLKEIAKTYRAKTVFLANGTVPARQLRALLDSASEAEVDVRIVPGLEQQLRGNDQMPIREVQFEDLLRREPARLDLDLIASLIRGKRVLVTGAGGSIGSELCRQLAKFAPEELILLGRGENRIFHIERELRKQTPGLKITPRIASMTDERRMEELFSTYRPQVVFHAAAHKHVPLSEQNIGEAVLNNIGGTKILADNAAQVGVEKFVLISTDKAVNPTSVMGCTKHLAERYCLAKGTVSETKFITTRFGNVLGSAGSVVPLFQEQIRAGGPITITDPRMTRFFMTIPEASQLVLQAASMGKGSEIFVLEMGEPVRIEDMARDLIRLAGLAADSIDIEYTGSRPGEKLYEELYYEEEQSIPTSHEKILSAYHRFYSLEEMDSAVSMLRDVAYSSPEKIMTALESLVPEFKSPERKGNRSVKIAT